MMHNTKKSSAGVVFSRVAFASSTALLVYAALGYPLLVAALSRLRPRVVRKKDGPLPTVSFIIAAFNEENAILEKLNNTLALDYPPHLLEIIVASDCSFDRTDDLVCGHPRCDGGRWGSITLSRLPHRGGKTAAQNAAVEKAHGEILVFSDATTDYDAGALRALMPNFADPDVGCVAGRLVYVDPNQTGVGHGMRAYWKYETFLKTCESRVFSLIGVSGQMYAVRREAYRPLKPESSSDFVIANDMVEQGLRAVFEPLAMCREETNGRVVRELNMRTRIIAQTYYDLWDVRALMNPRRTGFYAIQLWSHKVLRYAVPLFMLVNFVASTLLVKRSKFHRFLFGVQALVCALGVVSSLIERTSARSHKLAQLLTVPRYFLFSNATPFMALWQVIRGERYAQWDTARQEISPPDVLPLKGRGK